MAGHYAVCPCGSIDCPGWCGPEEEIDPELESLAETPEGMGWELVEEEVEEPFATRLAEILAQMHEAERAKAIQLRAAA